jgi:hypothetical protein
MVVTYKVAEGKTVMTGNKVNAIQGLFTLFLIYVCTTAYTAGKSAYKPGVPAPKAPYFVSIAPVPFSPPLSRKRAYLICPGGIPSFGNELNLSQKWILCDSF